MSKNAGRKCNKSIGADGESIACTYLEQQGLEIIKRNYRSPYGEVDIIGKQAGILVFVEVKTRRSMTCGLPEDSVTTKKLEKIINTAEDYIQKDDWCADWRIDVVSIVMDYDMRIKDISWFQNVTS